jgi:hypothetical protein
MPPKDFGEDGRQAPQRRVQLAQLVVLGVLVRFDWPGGVVRVGSTLGTVAGLGLKFSLLLVLFFCC